MELARVFLPDDGFEIISYEGSNIAHLLGKNSFFINEAGSSDRDEIKREMYELLSELTGKRPPWGTLTGVRPLKPALALCCDHSVSEMEKLMRDKYLMSPDKSSLIADIADYQLSQGLGDPSVKYSIYVGIPFCPTRCAYCSFASNVAPKEAHERYLTDLLTEIGYMGDLAGQKYTDIDSIYIGGGTPTCIDDISFEKILQQIEMCFDLSECFEYTVEAGRPETISESKLCIMKKYGVNRISVNPQTLSADVLSAAGRKH
jgi:oxygen-independent coproporphyrinogen-3 oxidase